MVFLRPCIIQQRADSVLFSKMVIEDPIVDYFSSTCLTYSDARDQVDCVVSNTEPFYKYDDSNRSELIKLPSEFISEGGICRDSVVFYGSIFKKMDWGVKLIYPVPSHVAIIVNKQVNCTTSSQCWLYCIIEGAEYICSEVGI
jgi:hypothetical protein